MARIPQRDVNLARKLHNLSHQTGLVINILLDPGAENPPSMLQEPELRGLEEQLLDCHAAIRSYRRVVNPVEIKGQRG